MPRGKTYANAAQAIGDTPMIQINRLVPEGGATVFAKCEFFQPLNSVKDRIGVAMIEAGERDGKIHDWHPYHRTHQWQHRYRFSLCVRRQRLQTDSDDARIDVGRTASSVARYGGSIWCSLPQRRDERGDCQSHELVTQDPQGFMPQQFENPANPAIHEKTTGPEIWEDSGQNIDAIVAGVGTGGTITGWHALSKASTPTSKPSP
jgi:cysteine synthase